MTVCRRGMRFRGCRWRGRRFKFCGEHQNQRSDCAKAQDGIEFRKREANRPADVCGDLPDQPAGRETYPNRERAAAIRNFDARVAVRALEAVGKSYGAGCRDFFATDWTDANRHDSPRMTSNYNRKLITSSRIAQDGLEAEGRPDHCAAPAGAPDTLWFAFPPLTRWARLSRPWRDSGTSPQGATGLW